MTQKHCRYYSEKNKKSLVWGNRTSSLLTVIGQKGNGPEFYTYQYSQEKEKFRCSRQKVDLICGNKQICWKWFDGMSV